MLLKSILIALGIAVPFVGTVEWPVIAKAQPVHVIQPYGGRVLMRPQAQAASPGWAATATQALPLVNATYVGALDPATPLRLVIGLSLRNSAGLAQLIAAQNNPNSPLYETTLTPAQVLAAYGPTNAQTATVANYLQSSGFTNISIEPNNLLVSANATAAQASRAFNTSLGVFVQNGVRLYANTAPAQVPAALGGIVTGVLGLSNAAVMRPTPHIQPCTAGVGPACARFYDPPTFQKTYDAVGLPTGYRTTVAIMAEGDLSEVLPDLRFAEKQWGLPQVPYTVVPVGIASPDTAGLGEWDLDTQMSSGMAGMLRRLYVYDATSLADSDIALEYNRWVSQDVAQIGNSSFGECEYQAYLDGAMLVDDMIMAEGAVQGQTMFASTGDSGGFCSVGVPNGVPVGAPFVNYPAASPYIVAVGGTDLFSNPDGSYMGEAAWEAGGGGISQFEPSPFWQNGIVPVHSVGVFTFRGMPDVAMDAGIETGALTWQAGVEYINGGTSLSSPLSAGMYARLQTAKGNRLGFAPPKFYAIYAANPTAGAVLTGPPPTEPIGGFHDILVGSDGPYSAGPRWDFTTGLGSFDGVKMYRSIR